MAGQNASSAATDMIEQLMPLRSDPSKLHDALARFDTVQVEDAFVQLLAMVASVEENVEKRRNPVRGIPNPISKLLGDEF